MSAKINGASSSSPVYRLGVRPVNVQLLPALLVVVTSIAIADPADHEQLQEVVVTASKRSEPLQDVPAAVTAVTGDALKAMGAEDFVDYARTIPGLTFTDTGAGRQTPSIRGISPGAGAGTVGYYMGETPIPDAVNNSTPEGNNSLPNPYLVDIDRIEVLRGPQGTLYGSGSMGGTIKLIPTPPNLSKFEGSVRATVMDTQGAGGASPGFEDNLIVNVPIIDDRAGIRVVAWDRDEGGYINRTYGYVGKFDTSTPPQGTVKNLPDEHTSGARALALVQPTDQLSITALAYIQRQHFDGYSDITGGATNPGHNLVQVFSSDTQEQQQNNFGLYSIEINYKFDRFNLVSSTSYYSASELEAMEGTSAILDFLGPPAFPNTADTGEHGHEFTQEMRVATTESIFGFDAIVGAFYSRFGQTGFFNWSPPQYDELVAGNNPNSPLYAPNNDLFVNPSYTYQRTSAQFGELTYHPLDALSVTGGIRHYKITNGGLNVPSGYFLTPGSDVPQPAANFAEATGNVYKGNVSYKIAPDNLIYAQYSQGFRPGFGNTPLPAVCNASGKLQVQPDSTKNFELGSKNMWDDKRLSVNAAVYRINWTAIQQGVILPCGFPLVANFGSAVIKGAELEANYQFTQHLTGGLSGTYLSAKLQQAEPALSIEAGEQIQEVPNSQISVYGNMTYGILRSDDGFTRIDFQYTGSSWGNYNRLSDGERDPASRLDAVRMLNIRSGIKYSSWEFSASVNNLLNQVAIEAIDPNAGVTLPIPGRPRLVVSRPRTFFLSALYNF